jgi:hypothetical protein
VIAGRATPDGVHRFHARHAPAVAVDHARPFRELVLSSVGLGTYLGAVDDTGASRSSSAHSRPSACAGYRCNRDDARP